MPHYHTLGTIPRKRHIVFRKPDGGLYAEELMGHEGFHGTSSLLYHIYPPTTVKSVAQAVTSRKTVVAPVDQYMNPIYAVDLAELTVRIAQKFNGIWHVAGDETVSKYDFAMEIAKYFGKERLVEGVTSDKLKYRAPRPNMGALDCSELSQHLGVGCPKLSVRLNQFLEAEYGA